VDVGWLPLLTCGNRPPTQHHTASFLLPLPSFQTPHSTIVCNCPRFPLKAEIIALFHHWSMNWDAVVLLFHHHVTIADIKLTGRTKYLIIARRVKNINANTSSLLYKSRILM
jgi:hypothetical protein